MNISDLENKCLRVVESLPVGIYETSPEGKMLYASPFMVQLFGYKSLEELMQVRVEDFYVDPSQREELLREALKNGGVEKMILKLKKADGSIFFCSCNLRAIVENGEIQSLRGSLIDVTEEVLAKARREEMEELLLKKNKELEQKNEEIRELAERDHLTGLYNYRFFKYILEHNIAIAKRAKDQLAFLMIDIDHFKEFNDVFGHEEGNKILARLAKIMKETARESDVVARYGGEEFCVICTKADASGAAVLAERLRERVEKELSCEADEKKRRITVSIGVAELREGDSPESLIKNADEAMYDAKHKGRNLVCVSTKEEEQITTESRQLKQALLFNLE